MMQIDTIALAGDSPGTQRQLVVYRYGTPGARPKVYLQAGLHADEMPGVLVLQHLLPLLDGAEAAGRIRGEVVVVPLANPIGLAQWSYHRPVGRFHVPTMSNFNRNYPDLGPPVIAALDGKLTADPATNTALVRAELHKALDAQVAKNELDDLRLALLRQSIDADHVLDLHCDQEAVVHHYASSVLPQTSALLGRCIGSRLALIAEVSGGHAFDEAHTAPWAGLRRAFGPVIAPACFSTTVEYRGQGDVDEATAASDAKGLFTYLVATGTIAAQGEIPSHPDAPAYPLAGYVEVTAPQGGVVSWAVPVGTWVKAGDLLAQVRDPQTRAIAEVRAPIDGLMFRRELSRSCLRGHGLAHVAGDQPRRSGDLLTA